tara:strand:+ start:167 stop:376 length:210 start_codon:yes stop_codon:yes gene_type:complete
MYIIYIFLAHLFIYVLGVSIGISIENKFPFVLGLGFCLMYWGFVAAIGLSFRVVRDIFSVEASWTKDWN